METGQVEHAQVWRARELSCTPFATYLIIGEGSLKGAGMSKITFPHDKKGNLTHEVRFHKALIPALIIICIICAILITLWSGSIIAGLIAGFFIGYWITLGLFAVIDCFFCEIKKFMRGQVLDCAFWISNPT